MTQIKPADYVEPRCPLGEEAYGVTPAIRPIPQQRIIQKMDEYMSRRDYEGAERHLLYWLTEAELGNDRKGKLMILNELVGHYRKTGEQEKAFQRGEESLQLLLALAMEDTISAGTTYVNYATACNAFGENEKAMELFEKARVIYESTTITSADRLGGLYNNMALTCTALGRFKEAFALYNKALTVMENVPNGVLEQAITYLNMADALEMYSRIHPAETFDSKETEEAGTDAGEKVILPDAATAEEQICEYIDRAQELLDTPGVPRDGYYSFVCEKCAPVFDYYGYFLAAEELRKRAGIK